MVNRLLQDLFYTLFPGTCLLCQQPSGRHFDLCQACEAELPWLGKHCSRCALPLPTTETSPLCGQCQNQPPAFSRCTSAWTYGFPVNHLITDFKHRHSLASFHTLAELWLKANTPTLGAARPDALMPVPLHWRRRWQRGFNQSCLLAEHWGKALQIPVIHNLHRDRHTPPQQGLSAADRRRNLRQAFSLKRPGDIAGKSIALVDDVLTTGATAHSLATILSRGGASRVDIWCLARTP